MSIEIIKLPKHRYNEAVSLIWEVFQVYEVPDFPPEGVIEYKRILDETEKLKNIIFYTAMENDTVVGVLGMRENNHIGYFNNTKQGEMYEIQGLFYKRNLTRIGA